MAKAKAEPAVANFAGLEKDTLLDLYRRPGEGDRLRFGDTLRTADASRAGWMSGPCPPRRIALHVIGE